MYSSVSTIWVLLGAALVFLMQAGFAMCEAGFTRAKNTGNILMKNLMDFCIGTPTYWILGFGLIFVTTNMAPAVASVVTMIYTWIRYKKPDVGLDITEHGLPSAYGGFAFVYDDTPDGLPIPSLSGPVPVQEAGRCRSAKRIIAPQDSFRHAS